jgi:hypothetical protein
MTVTATHPPTRRIAVFGSVAAERPLAPDRDETFSPAARAVLERVIEAIASSAPSIATPILDRAVAEGTITRAERHTMLVELSDPEASDERVPPVSQDASRTLREALAAIRRAAPGIARPILDEAVGAERLTRGAGAAHPRAPALQPLAGAAGHAAPARGGAAPSA